MLPLFPVSDLFRVSCMVSSLAQPQTDNALISDAEEHSRTLNCIPVLRFRIFNSWTDAYSIICNYNQTGAPKGLVYGDCAVTATGAPFNDAYRYVSGSDRKISKIIYLATSTLIPKYTNYPCSPGRQQSKKTPPSLPPPRTFLELTFFFRPSIHTYPNLPHFLAVCRWIGSLPSLSS